MVQGVALKDFEADLRSGAGDELRIKFCAVHSSAALAVNTFCRFKKHPEQLIINGKSGFGPPIFERRVPTGLGGTPPNLDVWLERGKEVLAVESKLMEYFQPKVAKFSESYQRSKLPYAEDPWWKVLDAARRSAQKRHLDVAQLVKHYLGLIRHLKTTGTRTATLLYLFWEPLNADEIDACVQHRKEVRELADRVKSSAIRFRWMTYDQLWGEWERKRPILKPHVQRLRDRYDVRI